MNGRLSLHLRELAPRVPFLPVLALALAAAPAAAQTTFTVDDDGGADFLDLPAAVAAAQPGDRILVAPGSYSAFMLNEGIVVLGAGPGTEVAAGVVVDSLPASQRAVLSGLRLRDLRVKDCVGTVALESLQWSGIGPGATPLQRYLIVEASSDVRLHRCTIPGDVDFSRDGAEVLESRLEVVQSTLVGEDGADTSCGAGDPGGVGLVASASFVHAAASTVKGGRGGDNPATCISFCGQGGGDGGSGMELFESDAVLCGRAADTVEGGMTGMGELCDCDGYGGTGLELASSSTAAASGVTLAGGSALLDCLSHEGDALEVDGTSFLVTPTYRDPVLALSGDGVPGTPLTFTVRGEPGANARLYFGFHPLRIDTPPVTIEQLISHRRNFSLGTLPASGVATFVLTTPTFLTAGDVFWAQADVRQPDSSTERTNSMVVVVR